MTNRHVLSIALLTVWFPSQAGAADSAPVSYEKQIQPIFQSNCVGCHQPGKLKGGLDMTSFKALSTGGKNGPAFHVGDIKKSPLITLISGDMPEMPAKGDPLTKAEVALITRWVNEGAKDDSTVVEIAANGVVPGPKPLDAPPVYTVPPVIGALAFSPDGQALAVAGNYETVLHKSDGSGMIARLVGGSPRILSMRYSTDGKSLVTAGGAPSQYGHVQIWNMADKSLTGSWKISGDTLFGINFNAAGDQIAFGCADKSARVLDAKTGVQLLRLDQHTDWCLGALFTLDGKRIVSGSRDQAMKLSTLANGQFIDDINNPLEPVQCMARHPKEDVIIYGGGNGTLRIYKISDNQNRTAGRNDTNQIKELERQPASVYAVAYSADGAMVVAGSEKEARVYDSKTGSKVSTLPGHEGGIFAVAFSADGLKVATGGYDGLVRIFDTKSGKLQAAFVPVPLSANRQTAQK